MQNILTQLAAALASLSMLIGVGTFTSTNQLAAVATSPLPVMRISASSKTISVGQSDTISASFTAGSGDKLVNTAINEVPPSGAEFNFVDSGPYWKTAVKPSLSQTFKPTAPGTYVFKPYAWTTKYPSWQTLPSSQWVTVTVTAGASGGDTAAPSVPTSLSGTAVSSSQINLTWTASTDNVGVTGYNIYRGGGNGLTTVATPPNPLSANSGGWAGYTSREVISSSQLTATGLTSVRVTFKAGMAGLSLTNAYIGEAGSGNAYSFASTPVQLTFNGGSASASIASNATITSDPVTFSVQPGQNVVISSYTAAVPADYEYSSNTGWLNYYIYANDAATVSASGYTLYGSNYDVGISLVQANSNSTKVGTSPTASYSDTGLTASTQYSYTVAAYDAAGNTSAQSASASAATQAGADTTAPSVPTGLSGSAASQTQINLTWTASTDPDNTAAQISYKVYRNGTQVGTTAAGVASYSDTGLTASTAYTYTVSAYDPAGNNSAQSSSIGASTGGSGGDLTGSGTASASDSYSSGGNPPWYAFDNNTTTDGWGNNAVMPSWLEYDLGSAQVASSYTLFRSSLQTGGWSKNGYSPSAWTFQGSNDGSTWTTLDTQTGQTIAMDAAKVTYSFSNSTAYRYYRIYITAAVSGTWVNITEMEIIGSTGGNGTAPVISAIASWNAQTATLVTWTTSVTATSKVVYGTTSAYGSASSSASLVTSHAISLFGLSAGTTYHYAVVSKDGGSSKTSTSTDQTFTAGGTTTISYPTVDPWFHGNGVNGALSAFWATGGQPRMNPIQFIPTTGDAAAAQADGYTYYGGLDGAAPACIQNDIPNCHNISTAKSWIESAIDSQIAEGAKYFYVDEPCFNATDFNTGNDRCSVPYNVAGINALADYIHAKCSTCKFGYSSSQTPDDMKILMDNGARPDLYQHESYEFWEDEGDPFAALHAAYPSVLRSWLIESIPTFCADEAFSLNSGKVDMLGLWDIDNSGSWGYPRMEPTQLSIFQYFAATGDKSKYCQQTWTWDPADSWRPILPGGTGYTSPTRTIQDKLGFPGWTSPYSLTSCDYRVYSGTLGYQGIVEYNGSTYMGTGMTLTRDWTSRTCNGTITLSLGPSGDCRDELDTPITGYIDNGAGAAGTVLHVVSGTFTNPIAFQAGIIGTGVTGGTFITDGWGDGGTTGSGNTGTYTVNNSQLLGSAASPVNMSANYGYLTCLVETRSHNNSSDGVGVPAYEQFNVAF